MKKCSECNNWGCTLRDYVINVCPYDLYETWATNSMDTKVKIPYKKRVIKNYEE